MADTIDEELKTRYCFSKNSIEFIADLISEGGGGGGAEDIERDTKRNKAGVEFVFIIRSNWLYAEIIMDTSDLALDQQAQGWIFLSLVWTTAF